MAFLECPSLFFWITSPPIFNGRNHGPLMRLNVKEPVPIFQVRPNTLGEPALEEAVGGWFLHLVAQMTIAIILPPFLCNLSAIQTRFWTTHVKILHFGGAHGLQTIESNGEVVCPKNCIFMLRRSNSSLFSELLSNHMRLSWLKWTPWSISQTL
jgi:hypothetical protein